MNFFLPVYLSWVTYAHDKHRSLIQLYSPSDTMLLVLLKIAQAGVLLAKLVVPVVLQVLFGKSLKFLAKICLHKRNIWQECAFMGAKALIDRFATCRAL